MGWVGGVRSAGLIFGMERGRGWGRGREIYMSRGYVTKIAVYREIGMGGSLYMSLRGHDWHVYLGWEAIHNRPECTPGTQEHTGYTSIR